MLKSDKVLNVINYTKITKNSYSGKTQESGYHSFVLDGKSFDGARNNADRISKISKMTGFDFYGKVVLDLGCNMGGFLHSVSSKIKYGVGVDFDKKCINVANLVKDINKIHNLNFYVFDLDGEDLELVKNFVLEDRVDVCLFLSVAQHIKKWKNVIDLCCNVSDCLLFESNGKLHLQDAEISYVKSLYKKVDYLYSESRRSMYLCHKT